MLHSYPLRLLLLSLVQVPMARASQQEDKKPELQIHVSPMASESGFGTVGSPTSLSKALNILKWHHNKRTKQDIRVVLSHGTCFLKEPLRLGPEHVPFGHRVTIAAAPGAKPVISGGQLIREWQQKNGMFQAKIPGAANRKWPMRELFINGNRRPRARHPNKGFLRIDQSFEDKRNGFTFKPGDIPKGSGAGAELVFLHDWSMSRIAVKAIDRESHSLSVVHPIGCKASHYRIDHFEKHPRYFLENHIAFLDQPGEWHLDSKTGLLSYLPLPGEKVETLSAVAPVLERILLVQGTEEAPVHQVHFEGITFRHAQWQLPPGGYASGQATVHEHRDSSARHSSRKMMESAIVFERAESCSITRCRIEQIGCSGILLGQRTKDCHLERNMIEDISGNGINIGEDSSRRVKGKTWWQAAPEQIASRHTVANNRIQNIGQQFYGSVGIWVGLAQKVHIHHNEIRQLPYTGVSLGWMWNPQPTPAGNHRVEQNHIHHIMQKLSDGGGIYTLGRQPGTILRRNHIHHIPVNLGRAESNGMFLDQGSDQITIAENAIYAVARSPLRFHQARSIKVRKNILVVPNPKIPAFRYNRTKEETIEKVDNRIIEEKKFNLREVERIRKEAGIQR